MARSRANVARWDLNILILLFAILIIIIILTSQGVGASIVAAFAILGLVTVWLLGQVRGRQLCQRFYAEQLSSLQQEPGAEAEDFGIQLTSREMQILNYVAQGYANKRIALELGISENTVKHFVTKVLSKLNATDRTEAVVIAIRNGLISIR